MLAIRSTCCPVSSPMPKFQIGNNKFQTFEVRISSLPNPDRPFDYDIGWFAKHSNGAAAQNVDTYLDGAFGAPNALPDRLHPNPAYTLPVSLIFPIGQVFEFVLRQRPVPSGRPTELSGGLAIVRDRAPVESLMSIGGPARINITLIGRLCSRSRQHCSLFPTCDHSTPGWSPACLPAPFAMPMSLLVRAVAALHHQPQIYERTV